MCIWGGGGELALVPKINPGNPVPGRGGDGGAHVFKTKKNRTTGPDSHSRPHLVSWERQTAKVPGTGTENLYTLPPQSSSPSQGSRAGNYFFSPLQKPQVIL